MKTMTVNIEGMCCGGCVNSVQTVLKGMDSISSAVASIGKKNVTIEYETSEPSIDSLREAIASVGYKVAD
jgi:copper chaperone